MVNVPFTGETVELDMSIEIGVGDCLNIGLGDSDSLEETAAEAVGLVVDDLLKEVVLVNVLVRLTVAVLVGLTVKVTDSLAARVGLAVRVTDSLTALVGLEDLVIDVVTETPLEGASEGVIVDVRVSLEVGETDTGLFEGVTDLETVGVGVSEGS